MCVKATLLTCSVFFDIFIFRLSVSCSGLAGKFDAVLTCLLGMFSRHAYLYPERNMNGLIVTCITPYIVNQIQRQEAKKPKVPGAGFLFA